MPWNNQGGRWQGGGQGPWGGRPSGGPTGGGGQQPPDLEELIRKGQDRLRQMFPGAGGPMGNRWLIVGGVAVLAAIWLASGFYRVQPAERGVELMFGRYYQTTEAGLRYHLPWPIQTVIRPEVERVNRVEIGFRSASSAAPSGRNTTGREVLTESLMLTGDENIVDINFVILWKISVPEDFLFNVRDPEETVKAAAESVMRELVGRSSITDVTTEGRGVLESDARAQLQALLDSYGAGILVNEIQLQKADPPAEVIDAFRDVQRAQADRERLQNEAEAFANDIIPRARGEADQLLQQAQAYREEVVARASGDAARFTAVWQEYANAREVTARRLYLETMEDVLRDMNKLVIDSGASQSGVLPFLPLPSLQNNVGRTGGTQPTTPGMASTAPLGTNR